MNECSSRSEGVCLFLAEAVATFALVFAGTGAIIFNDAFGGPGHTGIAIVFGAVVAAMILVFGPVSGAHMNPAVSIAMTLARELSLKRLPLYLTAQAVGGFAASGFLFYVMPEHATLGATTPRVAPHAAFLLELLLTFLLMEAIVQSALLRRSGTAYVAATVGLIVGLQAMFARPAMSARAVKTLSFLSGAQKM
ncbi:aquaporin [Leptonema illini]|uniref:Major intrinsic protein n=1 Tax=Leptonema illini DSM 21528 TaxID=929563 RepID=H2CEQ9_9LEPT|nr:aquaporin [Leptonema illini]EHQ06671.1 major intrinsic protein [Leptonema illini DSM 21528]